MTMKPEFQSMFLDHYELRTLGERFADTANRRDFDGFVDLWTDNGVWEIGPPINVSFAGRTEIRAGIEGMLGRWDFFVQLPTAFDVRIRDDNAIAYWTVHEVARTKDASQGNDNLSLYLDDYVRVGGRWLFQRRRYRTIYSDAKPLAGQVFHLAPGDLDRFAGPLDTNVLSEKDK
jgi:ketosteroid isomerase-like protein